MIETQTIEIPDELLDLLQRSRLGEHAPAKQVRLALAIHLFQEGVVSIGKAAALAGEPRISFEQLLIDLGIPVVHYDLADYEDDIKNIALARSKAAKRESGH